MGQTGSKLAFYTGGSYQNVLHSQGGINTGQYVHAVVTRDQNTGQKCLYLNGVLDSSLYSDTDTLNGAGDTGLTIGYNNGQAFAGEMDEIQFYSGVLSSSEVAFLYHNPGTNVADTSDVGPPLVARYDFEITNAPGTDSSGHNNDTTCYRQCRHRFLRAPILRREFLLHCSRGNGFSTALERAFPKLHRHRLGQYHQFRQLGFCQCVFRTADSFRLQRRHRQHRAAQHHRQQSGLHN
jgi:hypothetical protein